jgi:hypothetical protein
LPPGRNYMRTHTTVCVPIKEHRILKEVVSTTRKTQKELIQEAFKLLQEKYSLPDTNTELRTAHKPSSQLPGRIIPGNVVGTH